MIPPIRPKSEEICIYESAFELNSLYTTKSDGFKITPALPVFAFILIAAVFFLGIYYFKNKSSETSGRFFRSYPMYRMASVMLVFFIFCCILQITGLARTVRIAIALLGSAVLFTLISLFIFKKKRPVFFAVCAAAMLSLCAAGLICDYDKLPDEAQIKQVSFVSDYVSPFTETMRGNGASYFVGCGCAVCNPNYADFYVGTEVGNITALHENILSDGYLAPGRADAANTGVLISYVLKDNTQKSFYYPLVKKELVREITELEKSDFRIKTVEFADISYADVFTPFFEKIGTVKSPDALKDALVSDIGTRDSYAAINHTAQDEKYVIYFSCEGGISYDNRTDAAAYKLWNSLSEEEREYYHSFERFNEFYFQLTTGYIPEDINPDGYEGDVLYEGEWEITENALGEYEFVCNDDAPEIVKRAADAYNSLTLDEAEVYSRLVNYLPGSDGFYFTVTSDMPETVRVIEETLEKTDNAAPYEYVSAKILPTDALKTYPRSAVFYSCPVPVADAYNYEYADGLFKEKDVLKEFTDSADIEKLLCSSVCSFDKNGEEKYAVMFSTAQGGVLTKFITPAELDALLP